MGLLSFIERVVHIQLYGAISTQMTEGLIRALKYKNLYGVQLIAVSINSPGGSLTQAKNINYAINKFSRETGAPVFTFAEDVCLSAANSILAAGNRSFANEFSLVGDYAFNLQTLGLQNFIKANNIEIQTVTAGKNKAKLNTFEDLKEEDKKWAYHMLYEHEYELKNQIVNYRGNIFHQLGLKNEDVEEKIFKAPVLSSQEALKLGVIDGISSLEKVVHDKYHGVKILEIMKAHNLSTGSPKNASLAL